MARTEFSAGDPSRSFDAAEMMAFIGERAGGCPAAKHAGFPSFASVTPWNFWRSARRLLQTGSILIQTWSRQLKAGTGARRLESWTIWAMPDARGVNFVHKRDDAGINARGSHSASGAAGKDRTCIRYGLAARWRSGRTGCQLGRAVHVRARLHPVLELNTDRCPTGSPSRIRRRARALVGADTKIDRVYNIITRPCKRWRNARRRRPRSSAAVAADPFIAAEHRRGPRCCHFAKTISRFAAPGPELIRRHQRPALPRRMGDWRARIRFRRRGRVVAAVQAASIRRLDVTELRTVARDVGDLEHSQTNHGRAGKKAVVSSATAIDRD